MAETAAHAPFRRRIRQLMAERGLTFRSLAQRTRVADATGKGLSSGYLSGVTAGHDDIPSLGAIELIAEALDAVPVQFTEYRLALVRRAFDEREPPRGVGLERAAENLRYFESAFGGLAPVGPLEAAEAMGAALDRADRQPETGSASRPGKRAAKTSPARDDGSSLRGSP